VGLVASCATTVRVPNATIAIKHTIRHFDAIGCSPNHETYEYLAVVGTEVLGA
jgi:hypothetical protein